MSRPPQEPRPSSERPLQARPLALNRAGVHQGGALYRRRFALAADVWAACVRPLPFPHRPRPSTPPISPRAKHFSLEISTLRAMQLAQMQQQVRVPAPAERGYRAAAAAGSERGATFFSPPLFAPAGARLLAAYAKHQRDTGAIGCKRTAAEACRPGRAAVAATGAARKRDGANGHHAAACARKARAGFG